MSSPRVGLALVDAGNQFQQLLRRDAEAAAAKAGVALTTVFTGEGFNDHLAALRAMLADPAGPPQAIVVMAVRDQGLGRLLRDAAALGVHWAFLNDTEDDLAAIAREHPAVCLTAVCVDEQAAGRIQGEHIRRLVPAGRRVLYVQGSPRSLTSRLRTAGMQEATAGSGVEVVLAGGEWARQRAAQTIHDWLRFCAGRRRAFDLVSCQNDDLALGVIEALASESQKAGRADLLRIPVTGCDGAPDVGERLVREGRLAATVVLPRVAAPAVELLARVLATGERPPLRVTHVPLSLPGIDELRVAGGGAGAFGPGDHGSTFGGNPVVCAAALAVCDAVDDELLAAVRANGARLRAGLDGLPHVVEVRGRGLLVGAELDVPAQPVVDAALDAGLVCLTSGANVLRLAPPLVVDASHVDRALAILTEVLHA